MNATPRAGQVWQNVTRRHGKGAGNRALVVHVTTRHVRIRLIGNGWNRTEKPITLKHDQFVIQFRLLKECP